MSIENKFEWTDELVREYTNSLISPLEQIGRGLSNGITGYDNLKNFKKSKQQNTIQKDWEIMSFVVKSSRVVLGKTEEGDFGNNIFRIDENELLKSPNHKINSVKRISDGEVFSLGDEVLYNNDDKFKIHSFNIVDSWYSDIMVGIGGGTRFNIITLQKVNQPLFKTEDGIDVFEGDRYYVVIEKDGFGYETFAVAWPGQGGIESANYKNAAKFFSDKEKANEYILMNKPVLSVNDVLAVCENNYWGLQNKLLDRLKEIAKSKIEGK